MDFYGQNPYERINQFQQMQRPMYQQQMQLIKVSGLDGAKAFQMPANSAVALFNQNEDIMYIKTTDGAGFPSIRSFAFKEVAESQPAPAVGDYVTKQELESILKQFREEFNGKQSVRQQPKSEK